MSGDIQGFLRKSLAGILRSAPSLFIATHENSSGFAWTSVLIGRRKYKKDFLPPLPVRFYSKKGTITKQSCGLKVLITICRLHATQVLKLTVPWYI